MLKIETMKVFVYLLVLGCLACAGKPKGFRFQLKGDFVNVDTATVTLYTLEDEPQLLLSARMQAGKFVLRGSLPEPGNYLVRIGNIETEIVLDAADMFWPSDYLKADVRYIKNSPAMKTLLDINGLIREKYEIPMRVFYKEYSKRMSGRVSPELENELEEREHENFVQCGEFILNYVREHSKELVMSVFIKRQMYKYGYQWGKRGYELLSPEVQVSQPGRLLKVYLDDLSQTVDGAEFPEITVLNGEGKNVRLKFGDGKVYLVDFWASWCSPCRTMMQTLKEIYKDYTGKPVDFVSISLDEKEKNWLAAHEEEQIPWKSYRIKDAFKSTIAKQLGIKAIPFIVLIDQEGKIVAKNLRGQKLMDKINGLLK